jgi:FKBP-type peptidyl-prolyl cis-trans isomerase FklB
MNKKQLFWLLLSLLSLGMVVSCSETDDDSAEEYPDWQARNEAFFASLEDSLSNGGARWKKIKTFTKDEKSAGTSTDYIYVKVLEDEYALDGHPLYTDTVRVAYRGRLLPSTSYRQGYVFDQTYVGNYDYNTISVVDGAVSSFKDGFATALLNMRKNERWMVYMPYQLAYGTAGTTGIPGYSVLIFDLMLVDYATEDEKMYPWTSRKTPDYAEVR